jgi:hypothetical protein
MRDFDPPIGYRAKLMVALVFSWVRWNKTGLFFMAATDLTADDE